MILNMVLFAVYVFIISMKESREPIMGSVTIRGTTKLWLGRITNKGVRV